MGFRAGFGLAALVALAGAFDASAQQQPAPAVVVAPARMLELAETATFTGRVTALQRVDIQARVTGFVETRDFDEGEVVEAGKILFKIEDDAYSAAVDEVQGSIMAAEAQRRLDEIERDRKRTLVERDTVAQSELDIAEAQLGRAEGELQRLRGQLSRARLDLSYTQIAAPFTGVIGLSDVDVGALVGPESGKLATLTRLDPISVEFPVATAELLQYRRRVAAGQASETASVTLTLADGVAYPDKGDIDFVDAQVSQGTDTVIVRALFDNPEGLLLDGALVGVSLAQDQPAAVLAVPQQAVQRDMAGAFVLVVDDRSSVELRRIDVARVAEGFAVIADGLTEGENVITEGVNKVRPGLTVDAAAAGG